MNAYIRTATGISIFFADDNSQHIVKADHPRFSDICKMAAEDRFDEILDAIDLRKAIDNFLYESDNARFRIENGVLTFDGDAIHSTLADRMIDMAMDKIDLTAMENFMVNLMSNPSYRAVTELYSFLEAGNLPITPDGYFLAYKKISDEYKDMYTGKMDNSIGTIVSMPRNQVNENKDETCSAGLHFCSYDYLNSFGGQRVVVLKINPRDVVSIPSDYNDTKGRCCEYLVLRELEDWQSTRLVGVVSDDGSDDYDGDDEYDEYGYDDDGYDANGYDDDGYDANGYDGGGYDSGGYAEDGYDVDGYDRDGYDYDGEDRDGNSRDDSDEPDDMDEEEYNPESDHPDDDDPVDIAYFQQKVREGLDVPDDTVSTGVFIDQLLNGPADDVPVGVMSIPAHLLDQPDPEDTEADGYVVYGIGAESLLDDAPADTQIKCVDQRNNVTYYYDTVGEAHEKTKVPAEYIRRVLQGQKESTLGFTFEEVAK